LRRICFLWIAGSPFRKSLSPEESRDSMRDQINEAMNRRAFFGRTAAGTGLAVAGSAAARLGLSKGFAAENPFALDLGQFTKTDVKLIRYEEVTRFRCPDGGPNRLVIGADQNIYLGSAKQVSVLSLSGELLRRVAVSAPVRCVASGTDGQIYAGLQNHIEVFSARGEWVASWESPGPRTWLSGLACGENELFAADSGSRTILRYDKSGKLLGRIGKKDAARSVPGLVAPSPYLDVEMGRDGLLRVNNFGRHAVETYTVDGDLEQSWGKPSAGIAGFCGCCNPVSVAMLPGGQYVTCEKGLPRVKVYSETGEFQCVVAGVESFPENAKSGAPSKGLDCTLGGLDVAVDHKGLVYVLDLVAENIRVLKEKS
jgi:hypothetical protein